MRSPKSHPKRTNPRGHRGRRDDGHGHRGRRADGHGHPPKNPGGHRGLTQEAIEEDGLMGMIT
eukprot:8244381-Pyramimonas_sp.AAC.1